jgi:hypothetical protein
MTCITRPWPAIIEIILDNKFKNMLIINMIAFSIPLLRRLQADTKFLIVTVFITGAGETNDFR